VERFGGEKPESPEPEGKVNSEIGKFIPVGQGKGVKRGEALKKEKRSR